MNEKHGGVICILEHLPNEWLVAATSALICWAMDAALCPLSPFCVITPCFLLPTCVLALANERFNPIELPQCFHAPPSTLHCCALEMNTAANDL